MNLVDVFKMNLNVHDEIDEPLTSAATSPTSKDLLSCTARDTEEDGEEDNEGSGIKVTLP